MDVNTDMFALGTTIYHVAINDEAKLEGLCWKGCFPNLMQQGNLAQSVARAARPTSMCMRKAAEGIVKRFGFSKV